MNDKPRPSRDETWLAVAAEIARRSTCLRRAVGCVLVNARGHVLSTGYNGRAAGLVHCNQSEFAPHPNAIDFPHRCTSAVAISGTNLDGCEAIHAEQNALLQCRDVYTIDTCYVTTAPCVTCTKLLLNTSCHRIVFIEEYSHSEEAKRLWLNAKREWSLFKREGED